MSDPFCSPSERRPSCTHQRRLPALAQQRYFVEGKRPAFTSKLVDRGHFQRVQHDRLRRRQPFQQTIPPVRVHQKADAAAMHAKNRYPVREEAMQRLEHEAVAAERNDDFGAVRGDARIALA